MSEDQTKMLENSPLLRRVLETLENLEAHIKTVETKIEQHGFNTKPMWEKTLAELTEVNRNLAILGRKIDVFNSDMLNMRAAQKENEERFARLESTNEGGMTTVN